MERSKPMTVTEAMKVLSVKPGTGPSDVRRAYLKLVKVWHPDLCGADEAHRRAVHVQATQVLNEAFALLKEGVPDVGACSYEAQTAKQDRGADEGWVIRSVPGRPEALAYRLRDIPEVGVENIFEVLVMVVIQGGMVLLPWLLVWLNH